MIPYSPPPFKVKGCFDSKGNWSIALRLIFDSVLELWGIRFGMHALTNRRVVTIWETFGKLGFLD